MLTYRAWCSAVDRELIDSALRAVCPPVVFTLGAPDPNPSPWVPEPVAVQNVLKVAQAVAAQLPDPLPENYRQDLESLLAQIIVLVAKRRASPKSPLETFDTRRSRTRCRRARGGRVRMLLPRRPRTPHPRQARRPMHNRPYRWRALLSGLVCLSTRSTAWCAATRSDGDGRDAAQGAGGGD